MFPIYFVETGTPIEELTQSAVDDIFNGALASANTTLKSEGFGVSLFFIHHLPEQPKGSHIDPRRNILLGIERDNRKEPIDMIDMRALNEETVKSQESLAEEMVQKVRQHLAAKETPGILTLPSGTKFDVRRVVGHKFLIDPQGYLTIDGQRIAFLAGEKYRVIKDGMLHSYTIIRLMNEGDSKIRGFDEYDTLRKNRKGAFFNIETIHTLALMQLEEGFAEDAKNYKGGYFLLQRDKLSEEQREYFYTLLENL